MRLDFHEGSITGRLLFVAYDVSSVPEREDKVLIPSQSGHSTSAISGIVREVQYIFENNGTSVVKIVL